MNEYFKPTLFKCVKEGDIFYLNQMEEFPIIKDGPFSGKKLYDYAKKEHDYTPIVNMRQNEVVYVLTSSIREEHVKKIEKVKKESNSNEEVYTPLLFKYVKNNDYFYEKDDYEGYSVYIKSDDNTGIKIHLNTQYKTFKNDDIVYIKHVEKFKLSLEEKIDLLSYEVIQLKNILLNHIDKGE